MPSPPLLWVRFDVVQKMEDPTIDERRRFWLLCYAITSMEKAIRSCDLIAEHCTDNSAPLFQPLSLAVHTYYGRPFVRSNVVGSLPPSIIPDAAKGIHSWLRHFRDGVMAHIDAGDSKTAGRPMNDVIYTIAGKHRQFSTLEARARPSAYADARAHCESMIAVFQDEMANFMERFHELLPHGDDEYLLSLADGSPLFIAGYDRLLVSDLHYK